MTKLSIEKQQVLAQFTLDELIGECTRRHNAGQHKMKLVHSEKSIFFDSKETDFTMVGDFKALEAKI